ncbi:LamG-like jellyroll fold domain-containing protein [Haliangium sp. UPWRP_2]|uniref:LamG-like jellyroll fold domain-containing protein n=1 Tax=Haliangium sp. UPWRP_2 TaxID=1931276 RepID=UPI001304BDFB|nr:LamG-like jellyroll fold domain-containing protein [Haliangium sp. UPWRP_2]
MKSRRIPFARAVVVLVADLAVPVVSTAAVPTSGLVGAYTMNGSAADSSGRGHNASTIGVTKTTNRFGAPSRAYYFNGSTSVMTIPDHEDFSVSTTGYLSISVWVRPEGSSLNGAGELLFADTEGSGYVHWMGKGNRSGVNGNREWTFRIYSADNSEGRHNRMSFYHFSYDGGLGPGSYVQDPVVRGGWIHLVAIVSKPEHKIWWYKNAALRDSDGFGPSDSYPIADADLRNGNAAVKLGSQDDQSYFKGAIDNLYFYNRKLTAAEITTLYNDRTP